MSLLKGGKTGKQGSSDPMSFPKETMSYHLRCIRCGTVYPAQEIRYSCQCGGMLDLEQELAALKGKVSKDLFAGRLGARVLPYSSGVWRYKELILSIADEHIVSRPEGNTNIYHSHSIEKWVGSQALYLKHEGENPTGSFKDRGMTVGVTQARALGCTLVACASTGNTSSSLAAYAALGGLKTLILVPQGKISLGKLSQTLAYGAITLEVKGDFDVAMSLVREVCDRYDVYLLNSVNPFRIEGQKSAVIELLEQRGWEVPDWIVLPAGNLGNLSAFAKGLYELKELGFIDRLPRLAAIQARGANPFYQSFLEGFRERKRLAPHTIATAIRIGDPVSYERAVRALRWTNGIVAEVTDQEIMDAKVMVDMAGIGCEPASASSVAGVKKLIAEGIIKPRQTVVGILTGNLLKDTETTIGYHQGTLEGIQSPMANRPLSVEPTLEAVGRILEVSL